MEVLIRGRRVELEPNSKPYLLKRLLADGLDTVLILALFLLLSALILRTPLANTYRSHFERSRQIETETVKRLEGDAGAISAALSGNNEYRSERFAAELHGYLLHAAACLGAELLVLLLVPLLNRGRATPGKLLTGTAVFVESRQTLALRRHALGRFLFVFLLDSLFLYLLTGIYTFLLVPVLRLTVLLLNRKNRTLCDFATRTMVIEKCSYQGIGIRDQGIVPNP